MEGGLEDIKPTHRFHLLLPTCPCHGADLDCGVSNIDNFLSQIVSFVTSIETFMFVCRFPITRFLHLLFALFCTCIIICICVCICICNFHNSADSSDFCTCCLPSPVFVLVFVFVFRTLTIFQIPHDYISASAACPLLLHKGCPSRSFPGISRSLCFLYLCMLITSSQVNLVLLIIIQHLPIQPKHDPDNQIWC